MENRIKYYLNTFTKSNGLNVVQIVANGKEIARYEATEIMHTEELKKLHASEITKVTEGQF